MDGTAVLGVAQASAGVATLTTTNLSAGTHSITAARVGLNNALAASSAPLVQTVDKASTRTVLTLSGLTLNVVVSAIAPGTGTPTGTLTFTQDPNSPAAAPAGLTGGSFSAPLSSTANPILTTYSGDGNFKTSVSNTLLPLAAVNAASYTAGPFAADEIVTLFSSDLAKPTVSVLDSQGTTHNVDTLYASPTQASFIMPTKTAPGAATITVLRPNRTPLITGIMVGPAAPGLFTLNSNGQGAPAAQIVRIRADGSQEVADVGVFDHAQNRWLPAPIDLGAPDDAVYLILYGTGIRHYSGSLVCTIPGQQLPITFAGEQGGFAGLDQINVLLPHSLDGIGTVEARLIADGIASNSVTLKF